MSDYKPCALDIALASAAQNDPPEKMAEEWNKLEAADGQLDRIRGKRRDPQNEPIEVTL